MERRRLGGQGPQISAIGYGAWGAGGDMWGAEVPAERVKDAMHAAIDAGISWIDTAEAYGDGRSETLVGEVVRERRGDVMVFTKVAPFATGTRPDEVRKASGARWSGSASTRSTSIRFTGPTRTASRSKRRGAPWPRVSTKASPDGSACRTSTATSSSGV